MNRAAGFAFCVAFSLLHGADRAQLAGRVDDTSGAALVDASLVAVNIETGIRRTARTGPSGDYVIGSLAPGAYKVTARKPGFQTLARLNVELPAGRETRLDFWLRVGNIREVITVEDRPRTLQEDSGSVGLSAGRSLIDTLPLGPRGILALVELAPGAVATPASRGEAGQFSVNGQRANTNYFTVDGVSANTGVTGSVVPAQFAGGALPSMTAFGGMQGLAALDALHEVRVETSSFAPQFGRMPGAQVALATRSGSSDWHGSGSFGFRHEKLAANDPLAAGRGYGRSPLRMNHWTAAVGGPLRRNRAFFFAAFEGLRLRSPLVALAAAPTEASRNAAPQALRPLLETFGRPNGRDLGGGVAELLARGSQPSRLDSGSLRIDYNLAPGISWFARYSQAPSSTASGSSLIEQTDFHNRTFTLGVTAASAGLVNDARVKVSGASVAGRWQPGALGASVPIGLREFLPPLGVSGNAVYGVAIGGLGQLLSGQSGRNRQGQLHLVDTLALTRGRHAMQFGVDYERLTPARENAVLAVAGAWPSLASLLAGDPMQTAFFQADRASSLIEILSLYFQDTWRPASRLTLTYGVRWEITPAPSIRNTLAAAAAAGTFSTVASPADANPLAAVSPPPLWRTRYGQVAPRVGAAWRLSERSVVRAGWGVFYNLGFGAATDPINGLPYNRWQTGAVVAGPESTQDLAFAPDLRVPYSHHWNVAFERALTGADVLAVRYVGSLGRHLLRREAERRSDSGLALGAVATNQGAASFHALEIGYRRPLARGLHGLASYRWGHSIDNGSWDSAVAMTYAGYTADQDRGSSSFDVRHSLSAALSYDSPGIGRAPFWRRISAGWLLQSTVRARTGFPIDVLASENLLGLGFDNAPRPDLAPGGPIRIAGRLNRAAFVSPAGPQGNLGRNAIAGFGMFQLDAAVRRRFPLGEVASLEFGIVAANALNHANLADPVRYLNSPFFGQPVSMLNLMLGLGSPRGGLTPAFQPGGARAIEASVKVRF